MAVRVYPSEARRLEELADERLGFAAGDGDVVAFEVLFRRHQPAVLGFCRHMLGRADEAQDAAQQTFLAAYRVLREGEPIDAMRPWLFTVARNRCISMLRARREHPSAAVAEAATGDGLASEVQARADLRALLRDVSELPEDQRAALLLAEVADLSHGEIAAVIGVRREKVKALVFQARQTLLAAKDARETPCGDVRQELATARGAALRRAPLRRHLHTCPGCREFRDQLRDQRRALRALIPVVPPALRDVALGAGAEAAGAGGAGVAAAAGFKAIAAKIAIGVTLTGGAAAGGTALVAPEVVSDRPAAVGASGADTAPANGGSEGAGPVLVAAPGGGVSLGGSLRPMDRHTTAGAEREGTPRGDAREIRGGGAADGRGEATKSRGPKAGETGRDAAKNGAVKRGGTKRGATGRGGTKRGAGRRGVTNRGARRGATNRGAPNRRGTRDGARKNGATRTGGAKDGAARTRGAKDGATRTGGEKDRATRTGGANDRATRTGGENDRATRTGGAKDGAKDGGTKAGGEQHGATRAGGANSGARTDGATEDGATEGGATTNRASEGGATGSGSPEGDGTGSGSSTAGGTESGSPTAR